MVKKLYHLINGIHSTMELINGAMELMQITTFSHFSACIYFVCSSECEENLTLRNRLFCHFVFKLENCERNTFSARFFS